MCGFPRNIKPGQARLELRQALGDGYLAAPHWL
jgi:hypothetical protein